MQPCSLTHSYPYIHMPLLRSARSKRSHTRLSTLIYLSTAWHLHTRSQTQLPSRLTSLSPLCLLAHNPPHTAGLPQRGPRGHSSPVLPELASVGQHWLQEGRQDCSIQQQLYGSSRAQAMGKGELLRLHREPKATADSGRPIYNTPRLTKCADCTP